MSTNNTSKMKKEISEYIVAHVLDHSDILIRGSQKRQNYDNEMRQELWSNLANKLTEVFDTPMEPEKVKQHFHNRRKAVMGRVRDDLKRHGLEMASVEEKMEWIKTRRVVVNENDLQIIEYFFNKEQDRDSTPAQVDFDANAMNFLNGLVNADASNIEGEITSKEEIIDDIPPTNRLIETSENIGINVFQNHQLFLNTSKVTNDQPSQLIVEVSNKTELKRLLALLIDNEFTRFAHVDEPPPKNFGIKGFAPKKCTKRRLNGDSQGLKKINNGHLDIPTALGQLLGENNDRAIGESSDLNSSANFLFEMAKQQEEEEIDEEVEADDDEGQIQSTALIDLVKSFGNNDSKKKTREDGISLKCELCKNTVRLNQSASKWNLYEHVVLNHSNYRPYKCKVCQYSGVRRGRVQQHMKSVHGFADDEQPENITTPDIREMWEVKMLQCFPSIKQLKGSSPTLTT